jgi:hypothetical protein
MRKIITVVVNKILKKLKGRFVALPLILKPREISDDLAEGCIVLSLFLS